MPQLHFSVDDKTAKRIQREAKQRGMTVSKYLAEIVTKQHGEWPRGYLAAFAGALASSPLREPDDLPLDSVSFDR